MPKATIVIPTYNRAALLKEAVNSVLNQSFSDFEIIVVDDGSIELMIPGKLLGRFKIQELNTSTKKMVGLQVPEISGFKNPGELSYAI